MWKLSCRMGHSLPTERSYSGNRVMGTIRYLYFLKYKKCYSLRGDRRGGVGGTCQRGVEGGWDDARRGDHYIFVT